MPSLEILREEILQERISQMVVAPEPVVTHSNPHHVRVPVSKDRVMQVETAELIGYLDSKHNGSMEGIFSDLLDVAKRYGLDVSVLNWTGNWRAPLWEGKVRQRSVWSFGGGEPGMSDGFSPGIVGSKMVSRRITGYPPKWEYTYRDYLKWLTEQPKPEAMSNE